MNKIGRYELPITVIVAVRRRTGWRAWFQFTRGYDAMLTNGKLLHFTEEEKQQYDDALSLHQATAQVYGMYQAMTGRA